MLYGFTASLLHSRNKTQTPLDTPMALCQDGGGQLWVEKAWGRTRLAHTASSVLTQSCECRADPDVEYSHEEAI